MKRFLTIVGLLFSTVLVHGQSTTFLIKGTIYDAVSNETLIGASVIAKPGVGSVTDLDGNFSIKVEPGTYNLKINYVGYTSQTLKVKVVDKNVDVKILLESQMLDEVEVSANIGTVRETPVAISNITQEKLQEELGGRDITMVMNSTPGVYASESGGGAGDSRVTLRGFDQTNIAVLVDGVPVNDMENGQVYWSNWDGLKDITKTMQIQRGLGATKLAVSSVGGTMNIITQGIDQKQTTILKREYGNNNYQSTTLSYNSGLINNKFGVVIAGSYRTADGWVQQTWNEAWSYYMKLQWKVNSRHLLSFNFNGAPQKHGQRNNKYTIGTYSLDFAKKVGIEDPEKNMVAGGVTTLSQGPRPLSYNANVGMLKGEEYNIFVNFYHKPLFNLSHFWNVTDKLNISTVGYASYGTGGGTGLSTGVTNPNPTLGYIKLDDYYLGNTTSSLGGSNAWYSTTEHRSSSVVTAARNDHKWYGLLSTASYQIDSAFRLTFGIDARLYRGLHYGQVYDLLGGGYYLNSSDLNQQKGLVAFDPRFKSAMKREGDKILYNYDGMVDWGGLFSQIEYKKKNWTAFFTATGSYTGYQRIDYFSKKDVVFDRETKKGKRFLDYFKDNQDKDFLPAVIGWGDTLLYVSQSNYIVYNNSSVVTYSGDTTFVKTGSTTKKIVGAERYTIDSKEAQTSKTKKKWFPGFTLKGGANYKINSNYNVYANFGVLQIAPKFRSVFNGNVVGNDEYQDADVQRIISQEIGAGAKYKKFAVNVNLYYTIWLNRPVPQITGQDGEVYNVNGMDATHKGIEFDGTWKIIKNLEFEGALAFADWRYTTNKVVYVYSDDGKFQGKQDFMAKNVHIGNTAQHQASGALKYYIIKRLFIKPRYTFFGKNYSNFDLRGLNGAGANKDSWMIPDYGTLDVSAGYDFTYQGLKLNLNVNVNNALNTVYINDAQNNYASLQNYDANSASVFFGQGRRYVIGIRATF